MSISYLLPDAALQGRTFRLRFWRYSYSIARPEWGFSLEWGKLSDQEILQRFGAEEGWWRIENGYTNIYTGGFVVFLLRLEDFCISPDRI